MKITFLGDIMIEPPVLKAAKRKDGTYDFNDVFTYVKPLLDEADYVIGNFEAPLAGKEAKYTDDHVLFNAPDEYADAVKNAGIDFVSTINNHTFDRGFEGMERTIRVLDEKGIAHSGTFLPGTDRQEAYYFDLNGVKIALIAYTYGINKLKEGHCLAEGKYEGTVNILKPQTQSAYLPGIIHEKSWVDKLFKNMHTEARGRIKKLFGICTTYARCDDWLDEEVCAPYIQKFQEDIRNAKEKADLVLVYPHMGGQFNSKPGYFTQYVTEKALEAGADALIASHSHAPQLAKMVGNVPVAYSIGNFNMSPRSVLAFPENLSQYGLALHIYIEEGKIQKATFSMLLNYEKPGTQISGYPVDALYSALTSEKEKEQLKKDVMKLYGTVTGKVLTGDVIRREYDLL